MRVKWMVAAMMALCMMSLATAAMAVETAANQIGPGKTTVLETAPEQKGPGIASDGSFKGQPAGTKPTKAAETSGDLGEADKSGAEEKEEGTWRAENGGWKYYDESGAYWKNKWAEIGGYWYYFGWDGYMATGWTRISGYNYCFRDTGDLLIGWCYNDDVEKWYYFGQDGQSKKGWFQDKDGSWYWFSSRGEMVSSGYRSIDGKRYYFMDDGQMAANQYVGLFYMDENGQRDKRYDITVEGRGKDSSVPLDIRNSITEALQNVPREWIKYFVDHDWKILYYPDKNYFQAPESDGSLYYVYHKLDTSYRKLKFCEPEALTEAFGEYIGYAAGCYEKDGQLAMDMAANKGNVDDFVDVPSYYLNDMQFYFGKLVEAYLSDKYTKKTMEENSPGICALLRKVLYQWQPEDSPNRFPARK